ncbi:EpsG family protein [Zobellia uliginosa]|uniref:EpsG family protein n=1 Tax=Zobellia uliginosa TaxID=143224 RepID=UPI0026E12693|nr:EpsG family protein [Zobellia uliginosa]MDO6516176.1 EpsG family protein [Zobellia uliginosa]
MTYYLVLYIYSLATSLLQVLLNKRISLLLFSLFLALIAVLAFRGSDGVDTENYLTFFNDIGYKEEGYEGLDIGFLYLSTLIKWIKNSEVFYFLCIAVLSVGLKLKAMDKLSPLPLVSAFVLFGTYFLSLEANQIRQALALGVGLLSLHFIIKRKRLWFFSSIILAATFHVSSIILLPAWWLFDFKISRKRLLLILGISFLFVFISLVDVFQFSVKYAFFWGQFIFSKLLNYASKMERVGFSPIQLWYVFISVVFIIERKRINNQTYSFLLNLFIIGVAMNFFLNSFSYMIRITYYFIAIEGVLLAYLLKNSKLGTRIVFFLLAAIMLALKNFKYYNANLEFFQ